MSKIELVFTVHPKNYLEIRATVSWIQRHRILDTEAPYLGYRGTVSRIMGNKAVHLCPPIQALLCEYHAMSAECVWYMSLCVRIQVQKFTVLEKDFSMPGGELGEFLHLYQNGCTKIVYIIVLLS